MNELPYNQDDLICALATGWSTSAIGMIRTSGTGAVEALSRIFSRPDNSSKRMVILWSTDIL